MCQECVEEFGPHIQVITYKRNWRSLWLTWVPVESILLPPAEPEWSGRDLLNLAEKIRQDFPHASVKVFGL